MSTYEDIQANLAKRAAEKEKEFRDREYTSWSPWLVPATVFSWTGPTYVTGPQYVAAGPITAATWMGARFTYSWATPVFDLRPDLRDIVSFPPNGVPIWNRSARLFVEVFWPWETTGTGSVSPPVTAGDPAQAVFNQFWAMAQEEVSTTEYQIQTPTATAAGAAYDSVYPSTTWYPLNPSTGMGAANTLGYGNQANDPRTQSYRFAPAGTELQGDRGSPIRYWRVKINFYKMVWLDTSSTVDVPVPYDAPIFTLRAGMY